MRGRGTGGKTSVFGVLKRLGKIYNQIFPDWSRKTLSMLLYNGRYVWTESSKVTLRIPTDFILTMALWIWGIEGICVNHGGDEFVTGKSHIKGFETFWSIAKMRLSKFRGMCKITFQLHLKGIEFRLHNRIENVY